MAFVFIDQSAPVLLLDFKLDSKQTPVPRIAVVRINILPPAFAIARSKTKRTESEQPRLENGDHRLDIPWARPRDPAGIKRPSMWGDLKAMEIVPSIERAHWQLHGAVQLCSMSAAARLPTFLSAIPLKVSSH